MDPRSFITLEVALSRRLEKDWLKTSGKLVLDIERLTNEGQTEAARKLVAELDLTDLGQRQRQYIRYMMQSCAVFGASGFGSAPGVLLNPKINDLLDSVTSQFLQYLEHGGSALAKDRALQLIARAEQPVKKADTPRYVKEFVSFKDVGNEQLKLISSLNSSRMASWGFLAEAYVLDIETYRLNAVLDGRTSDFCRWIHGKEFKVSDARPLVDQALSAQDPADLRTIQPWPSQSKASMEVLMGLSTQELVARRLHVPPFHPGCRTLLAKVGKESRLVRPPTKPDGLSSHTSTPQDFKALGVDLTPPQVDHWNAYVGVSPAEWLSKLSGEDPVKVLEGVFGKNSIKIKPSGDVVSKLTGLTGKAKYGIGTTLDPYTGNLYLDHLEFLAGSPKDEIKFMKNVLGHLFSAGEAIGASAVGVSVGQSAYQFAQLGFAPQAAQWQELRMALIDRLEDGDLKGLMASLTSDQKASLLNLLSVKSESAAIALANLTWTYRGDAIAKLLFEDVTGTFFLDLTDNHLMYMAKESLQ